MSPRIITSRHSDPAPMAAPSTQPHDMFGEELGCPPEQDTSSELFTLICGILMGAILGAILTLSFAPSWTNM